MIAGLLQSQNDITTQRIPGLGKLPVLGALFSSKAYQRRETDLVIIVTPYLVKPIDPIEEAAEPLDGTHAGQQCRLFPRQRRGNQGSGRLPRSPFAGTAPSAPAPTVRHFLDLPKE